MYDNDDTTHDDFTTDEQDALDIKPSKGKGGDDLGGFDDDLDEDLKSDSDPLGDSWDSEEDTY